MTPELILSSDSHVFEPPDLWTTRIYRRFRERAPRMQRIDGADQLVVDDQIGRASCRERVFRVV